MVKGIQCINCAWYFGDLSCPAFKQIPEQIITGELIHDVEVDGQNEGFVFKDKDEPLFLPDAK